MFKLDHIFDRVLETVHPKFRPLLQKQFLRNKAKFRAAQMIAVCGFKTPFELIFFEDSL